MPVPRALAKASLAAKRLAQYAALSPLLANRADEKSNVGGKSMIYGIGTDIINIERVEQILNKNKDGFVRRVLSEHEQALFANLGIK
jgi:hypothetical protein